MLRFNKLFLIFGFVFCLNINLLFASKLYEGPLYDAHAHLSKGDNPFKISKKFSDAGFDKVALFIKADKINKVSSINDGNILIFSDPFSRKKKRNVYGEKEFVYEFSNYQLNNIEESIKKGVVFGFGEIYIHLGWAPFAPDGIKTDIKSYGVDKLLKSAKKYDVPVQIHLDGDKASVLNKLLEEYKDVNFVLAHCGYLAPKKLGDLFDKHKNLYAETSLIFNPYIDKFANLPLENNELKENWKSLLITYSHRVMIGTDYAKFREDQLPKLAKYYRKVLGLLPKDKAENIAYKNFSKLFETKR